FYNCTNLKEVFCKPTALPTGGYKMFSYGGRNDYYAQPIGCIIYVPASDDDSIINAYKAADYWNTYADYIEEYDFTE
ncbi:MAG: hypothetical protein IIX42_07760, partial [Alistipes sp.]|nr:hypothetical protein [Alistipes sp.]